MAGKERQKGHGLYLTWLCRLDVRHGGDERRSVPASLQARASAICCFVLEPASRRAGRRSVYGQSSSRRPPPSASCRRLPHWRHYHGPAIPIIMGQNIGTCVTAMLSFHRRKHERKARRRGPLKLQHHRYGSDALSSARGARNASARIFGPSCHGSDHRRCAFALNIACTAILMPASGLLEKLSIALVPDKTHTPRGWSDARRASAGNACHCRGALPRVVALDMAQEASTR